MATKVSVTNGYDLGWELVDGIINNIEDLNKRRTPIPLPRFDFTDNIDRFATQFNKAVFKPKVSIPASTYGHMLGLSGAVTTALSLPVVTLNYLFKRRGELQYAREQENLISEVFSKSEGLLGKASLLAGGAAALIGGSIWTAKRMEVKATQEAARELELAKGDHLADEIKAEKAKANAKAEAKTKVAQAKAEAEAKTATVKAQAEKEVAAAQAQAEKIKAVAIEAAAKAQAKAKQKEMEAEASAAKAKAKAEIKAEKGKVAARVQEATKTIAERVKSATEEINLQGKEYRFEDILGQKDAVESAESMLLRILHPGRLTAYNLKKSGRTFPPILMTGPPGVGKTEIIRALVSTAARNGVKIKPYVVSLGSIDEEMAGHAMTALRALAEENTKNGAKTLFFFDEADSLKKKPMLRNELLTLMDGANPLSDDVIMMMNTNYPQDLSPAVLSRFPAHMDFEPAGKAIRKALFDAKIRQRELSPQEDVDLDKIATLAEGFNGRDINSVIEMLQSKLINEALKKPAPQDGSQKQLSFSQTELEELVKKAMFKVRLINKTYQKAMESTHALMDADTLADLDPVPPYQMPDGHRTIAV
jgi:SpoVK/Ycf46/Vps4 family AAA+-type ATPase